MTEKILFVDDEPNVLASIKRQFRKRFDLQVADSGDCALQILREEGPFAVIVSDMRMPGMSGVELLSRVKELYPDMVRIMLTGNADQQTAMEAVNTGHIFRFLTKPCPPATFITALALALRQYRLIVSEKELLQQTLKGSIAVLAELLSIANPLAFSSGARIKGTVVSVAEQMHLPNVWQYEIAAMISQIGCVTLPGDILQKVYAAEKLDQEEEEMFSQHPHIGAKYLEQIPRLENVARIIALQQLRFDEYSEEIAADNFEEVLVGAQILKAALAFDLLLFYGEPRNEAIAILQRQKGMYNPLVLEKLAHISVDNRSSIVSLGVPQIAPGMIAIDDVKARNGVLVIPKGQIITSPLVQGLINFSKRVGIVEPIRVQRGEDNDI